MRIENLMMAINSKSTSFFDTIVKTSGPASSICFRDIVKTGIGMIPSRFDQDLVLFVYLQEGDHKMIESRLFDLVYSEVNKDEILMTKVKKIQGSKTPGPFFKAARALDDILRNICYLSLLSAIKNRYPPARDAGAFIGCGKDAYISNYQPILKKVSFNISSRLQRAENKMLKSIYENS